MVSTRRKQQSTDYAVGDVVELLRVDGAQVGTLVSKKENASPSSRTGSPSSTQHWMVSVSDCETTIDMSEKYLGRVLVLNGGVPVSENSSLDENTGATTLSGPNDLSSSLSSPVIKMVVDGVTKTLEMNHGGDENASSRSTSSGSRSRSNSPHSTVLNNKRRRASASSNNHKRNHFHHHKASSNSTARTVKHHNTRRSHGESIVENVVSVTAAAASRNPPSRLPLTSGGSVSSSSTAAKGILTTRHGKMVYKNPMATGILYIYKDTHRAEFVRAK